MFALSVELLSDEEQRAIESSGAFQTVIHSDVGVQVEESELEEVCRASPALLPMVEDEELASMPDPRGAATSSSAAPAGAAPSPRSAEWCPTDCCLC